MPGIGAAGMKVPEMRAAEVRAAEIRAAEIRRRKSGRRNPEDKGQSGANPSSMPYRVVKRDGFIYEFYEKVFEKAVDYLNPETIASFIKLTHEEYRKRWGEDFGKLIPGIFLTKST